MKTVAFIAAAAVIALIASTQADAQVTYNYVLDDGSGSLLLDDPTYSGDIVGAFMGTFTIEIDDTLWPGETATDPTRFEHIWETYFADNYNAAPGAEAWFGVFDGLTMPSVPQFAFDTSVPGGILAGDISIVIQVRDTDADEVLGDAEKYANQQLTGTLNINPNLATGAFVDLCGYGALGSGNFNFVDPPDLDTAEFPGEVTLEECPPQPVEPSTWSTIKSLYQ